MTTLQLCREIEVFEPAKVIPAALLVPFKRIDGRILYLCPCGDTDHYGFRVLHDAGSISPFIHCVKLGCKWYVGCETTDMIRIDDMITRNSGYVIQGVPLYFQGV